MTQNANNYYIEATDGDLTAAQFPPNTVNARHQRHDQESAETSRGLHLFC